MGHAAVLVALATDVVTSVAVVVQSVRCVLQLVVVVPNIAGTVEYRQLVDVVQLSTVFEVHV